MYTQLDRIDRKILVELQRDGRISNVELAKRIGLSATPCLERVKKLEREGYIRGYKAVVDPAKLGQALLVYVEVTITKTSPDVFDEFNQAVKKHDEIVECHLVSGNFDFLLKTRVTDMSEYRQVLGDILLKLPNISESRTYVVMEEVKGEEALIIRPQVP
ncbi:MULTISPECIES: leucine-responsive transcriptional regulator Lrp [Pseudoalteromonas]|uniref:Leucine-responsive regulatory protein n=1 Tax=Pseudoalteromonas ruthenica TaxID=151081 RepID=A0A0F4PXN2_9GAMM|nr:MULTISPECIES: leucine-responsive transcriptional regulator Lrp [Pseudoalteromonas]KJY99088.1 leucine-responsive transcriptional regulator [Pseudoalteromonas ruthenica]KJY99869.1 leucine-responsive transcriptional regulator [Pseudoalteromonas ruthenica]MCF2861663.1 leucine-responsive transcriptional regulator Lrp [Pseudoalteromonas sp. CNAT2-18]MCG7542568.1 leucine-responsive transcriptional regulator Lrp [Pseudoalteromonas sp. MM17-2]MCG7557299.1 leucine-responsive transcriptional regulator|tara:strand:+ start:1110 stop:1589 length:480 start_codon:yes stop_codon:yes gene_type:complete